MTTDILICEDSFEGILSGIYDAYADHRNPDETELQVGDDVNLRLFVEYHRIIPDEKKAVKVSRTLKEKLGEEVVYDLNNALASEDHEKANAVYHTVALALQGKGKAIMDYLQNDNVRKVFELSRNVWGEVHHMYGFLRFEELEGNILYARINPVNNIITMLAPHFADRFPLENFVIFDERRDLYIIHPSKRDWFLTKASEEDIAKAEYSEREKKIAALFRHFVNTIAIESRTNLNLQRNMLPLRFRPNMTEFK